MQRKRIRKSGVQYFCTPLLAGAIFVWHQNRYKDDDEGEEKMYRNIGEGEVIAVGYFSKLQKKAADKASQRHDKGEQDRFAADLLCKYSCRHLSHLVVAKQDDKRLSRLICGGKCLVRLIAGKEKHPKKTRKIHRKRKQPFLWAAAKFFIGTSLQRFVVAVVPQLHQKGNAPKQCAQKIEQLQRERSVVYKVQYRVDGPDYRRGSSQNNSQ